MNDTAQVIVIREHSRMFNIYAMTFFLHPKNKAGMRKAKKASQSLGHVTVSPPFPMFSMENDRFHFHFSPHTLVSYKNKIPHSGYDYMSRRSQYSFNDETTMWRSGVISYFSSQLRWTP
jgi:hypothetical protein